MNVLIGIAAAAAAIAWLLAVVTGIRLIQQRSGRLSTGAMMVRGMAWFDHRNFKPEAAGLHRTFLLAFAGFFICILAIAIIAVLGARPS
ncbi:hypothetical protein [Reyranella sp. CPCC 100927]|uniref:hypothetical protein n=1 Tax=Reyranella sp. CPCC 100927 TaxID=2599616 RepID=UPI0011B3CD13|nr:hypothetical protein [Reyranella sp. CPCC 100927]TWT12705.1 hypothetical protein FQU96_10615 [Reyranella sp. CPCC 100927]